MKLLLDGDLFCYRCAASAETTHDGIAFGYMEQLLDDCIDKLKADSFQFYLTGPTNFRFQVYPEYKANRLDTPKPRHLASCRDYLSTKYKAIMSDGCEADDLMGIAQCSESATERTTIVSLDKDLLQIPGRHYSWHIEGGTPDKRWVKEAKLQEVDKLAGLKWFYTQMITGDVSDNIKGISGIGKVGAARMLSDPELTENDMFEIVRDAYSNDMEMLMNGDCLYIFRNPNEPYSKTEMGLRLVNSL